jgi:hypothetical protein
VFLKRKSVVQLIGFLSKSILPPIKWNESAPSALSRLKPLSPTQNPVFPTDNNTWNLWETADKWNMTIPIARKTQESARKKE